MAGDINSLNLLVKIFLPGGLQHDNSSGYASGYAMGVFVIVAFPGYTHSFWCKGVLSSVLTHRFSLNFAC